MGCFIYCDGNEARLTQFHFFTAFISRLSKNFIISVITLLLQIAVPCIHLAHNGSACGTP